LEQKNAYKNAKLKAKNAKEFKSLRVQGVQSLKFNPALIFGLKIRLGKSSKFKSLRVQSYKFKGSNHSSILYSNKIG